MTWVNVISKTALAVGGSLYGLMLFIWSIEWRQSEISEQEPIRQLLFFLENVVFISGLPPLLLAVYFWGYIREAKAQALGFIIIPAFIAFHFYVAAVTAHGSPAEYYSLQLVELILALAVIYIAHRKLKMIA